MAGVVRVKATRVAVARDRIASGSGFAALSGILGRACKREPIQSTSVCFWARRQCRGAANLGRLRSFSRTLI